MGDKDLDVLIELIANSPKPEDSGQHTSYDLFYSGAHEAPMLPWSDEPLNDLQLAALGVDVYLYRNGLTQV